MSTKHLYNCPKLLPEKRTLKKNSHNIDEQNENDHAQPNFVFSLVAVGGVQFVDKA